MCNDETLMNIMMIVEVNQILLDHHGGEKSVKGIFMTNIDIVLRGLDVELF